MYFYTNAYQIFTCFAILRQGYWRKDSQIGVNLNSKIVTLIF